MKTDVDARMEKVLAQPDMKSAEKLILCGLSKELSTQHKWVFCWLLHTRSLFTRRQCDV
jgi:hypothetical protein